MSAELVLACIGTADLVLKYGKMIVDFYGSFKAAEDEIKDRIFLIQTEWLRTQKQIEFLKRISHQLDSDIVDMQDGILQRLLLKLREANAQIERLKKRKDKQDKLGKATSEFKRLKYAWLKETTGSLDKAIRELQGWQRTYDPSWFLLMTIADPVIDKELISVDTPVDSKGQDSTIGAAKALRRTRTDAQQSQRSIFRPASSINEITRQEILHSSATILQRSRDKWYILDSIPCLNDITTEQGEHIEQDVRNLADKLSNTDPKASGLLQCAGVIRDYNAEKHTVTSYDFIFYIPPRSKNPQSLRNVLITADPTVSLSTRFRLVKQLAQSVSYVHTYGFVHKSIRPDTLLVVANDETELASSFLLGFERFRLAGAQRTLHLLGDNRLEKQLYRHWHRQPLRPEVPYNMQHDIYNLGVCMLEIGLWQSFFIPHASGAVVPSALIDVPFDDIPQQCNGESMKAHLIWLAETELPQRMGDRYADVVVSCLTCLDELNFDFNDIPVCDSSEGPIQYDSETEISIGVRYIEKVSRYAMKNISEADRRRFF